MISPHLPRNARTLVQKLDGGRTTADAASTLLPVGLAGSPGGPAPSRGPVRLRELVVLAGLCLDDLVERQLAGVDLVDPVVGQAGIAVLVDRVGAENAIPVLRLENRVHDSLPGEIALVARTLDRVEHQGHRLVAVNGVRVRRGHVVLSAVVLEELLALSTERLGVERRDRALEARRDVGRDALLRVGRVVQAHAVAREQALDARHRRRVLHGLHAVRLDLARVDEAVGLDLRRERAVVRRLRVDPVVAVDLQTLLRPDHLHVAREARRVRGLRVPDRGRCAAGLLRCRDKRRRLDRVLRHDSGVGAGLGRVVLVRLARLGPRLVGRQADVRVRRADLRDTGLVQDRNRDLRDAGVVLADVADRVLVRYGLARVLGGLALVGRAGGRERVVETGVLDRVLADLAAHLVEREPGAVLDRLALAAGGALQRHARVDRQRRTRDLAVAAAASTAAPAAGSYAHGKRDQEAAAYCPPTCYQLVPPPLINACQARHPSPCGGRDAIECRRTLTYGPPRRVPRYLAPRAE